MRVEPFGRAEDWWTFEEACYRTDRRPRTMRRWLAEESIRTIRPKRTVLLYGPDVMEVEKAMTEPRATPQVRDELGRFTR